MQAKPYPAAIPAHGSPPLFSEVSEDQRNVKKKPDVRNKQSGPKCFHAKPKVIQAAPGVGYTDPSILTIPAPIPCEAPATMAVFRWLLMVGYLKIVVMPQRSFDAGNHSRLLGTPYVILVSSFLPNALGAIGNNVCAA
jgi:hypothetical protein